MSDGNGRAEALARAERETYQRVDVGAVELMAGLVWAGLGGRDQVMARAVWQSAAFLAGQGCVCKHRVLMGSFLHVRPDHPSKGSSRKLCTMSVLFFL